MRAVVSVNLILLALICPFICGPAGGDLPAVACCPIGCSGDDPSTPVHCPEEGASCFCQGAVNSVSARLDVESPESSRPAFPADFDISLLCPPRFDGRPERHTGSAGHLSRRDAATVRALLQTYRC